MPTASFVSDKGAPLFRHPRLIAAVMLVVLAFAIAGALYVRPLSGDTPAQSAIASARSD